MLFRACFYAFSFFPYQEALNCAFRAYFRAFFVSFSDYPHFDEQKAKRDRHLCDRARRRGFGIHGLTSQPLAQLKGDALSKT